MVKALPLPVEHFLKDQLWLAGDKGISGLHTKSEDNLYVQLRGSKRFVLLHPFAGARYLNLSPLPDLLRIQNSSGNYSSRVKQLDGQACTQNHPDVDPQCGPDGCVD